MQCNFCQLKAVISQKQQDLSQVRVYYRRFESKAVNSDWLVKLELLSSNWHMIMNNSLLMNS